MEYKVISADDHLDIRFFPKDIFTSRVPANMKDRVPHVVPTDNERYKPEDGMSDWVVGDKVMAPWGCYTAAQGSGAMWAIDGVAHLASTSFGRPLQSCVSKTWTETVSRPQ
jgi:hypothetical protein